MITDKDIQKLREVFATKDDIKDLENKVVKSKDEILGEIVKLRKDSVMDIGLRDQVEDHDRRLESLELIHPQGKHP